MSVRTITTSIKLDGEQEYKRQMSLVNGELKNLKSELKLTTEQFKGNANSMEALESKAGILTREIDQQREKVRALEKALEDSAEVYGEADSRTDRYRQSLNNAKTDLLKFQRELDDTNRYLDEARSSADKAARSIDEFGNAAKDAGGGPAGTGGAGGLGNLVSQLGNLKSALVGGAVVTGLKEIGGAIIEIVDSTEEYRRIMGTLEASSQAAGYSAEETAAVFTQLHGVMGDTQSSATAAANLQAIGLEQEQLIQLTDSVIGAWAKYGDSIPIDSLAEAINETIQVGNVTGVFADVLNWAGASEDAFNEKLQAASSTAERANLVLQELSRQGLQEAAESWREVNEDIVRTNESQARLDEAWGKMGETLAPVAAELKNFAADALFEIADILDSLIEKTGAYMRKNEELRRQMESQGYSQYGTPGYQMTQTRDGSHAGGLSYVPYDGYVAELHKGETVLTANEAATMRRLLQSPPPALTQGVTASDLQTVTAAAVNAMGTLHNGGVTSIEGVITLKSEDGQTFGRYLVPFVRSENKSNPEVVSDAL